MGKGEIARYEQLLLVTNNFFFSHRVFKILVQQTRINQGLFGKGLTHYHTMHILTHQRYVAVENILRKGEIACNRQFLLFSQCFLHYMALIFHFKCTLKIPSAFCFNLDQSKILSSGNGLTAWRAEQGPARMNNRTLFCTLRFSEEKKTKKICQRDPSPMPFYQLKSFFSSSKISVLREMCTGCMQYLP